MMKREGEVLFNGAKMEKNMKRMIGYVMQDDLLYESLTVFEVVRAFQFILEEIFVIVFWPNPDISVILYPMSVVMQSRVMKEQLLK